MQGWDADVFAQALDFAARAHGDQKVTGSGAPYVVHVVKVAQEALLACLAQPELDANLTMVCALLHDCIEDATVTVSDLEAQFGIGVANGVQALTKNKTLPKPERIPEALQRILKQPPEIWVVKLADRITNLEPPPANWSNDKRVIYRNEAQLIHGHLAAASPLLALRLQQRINAYSEYFSQ